MSNPNVFTNKEVEALSQFRSMVANLELTDEQRGDYFLIRWLRARDLNVKAAFEMIEASMKWRAENKLDEILTWEAPVAFQQEFAYDMEGFDKDGSPVAIIPFGKWDIRRAVESGQKDIYLRYFDQLCERALDIMRKKNKDRPANDPITQLAVIFDMDGFALRQITKKGTVDAILEGVKRTESNFPEILKISFTINAPRIFALLFALIKPLLTPRTLAKIDIHGSKSSKWKAALLKMIPADQLLPAYGGTRAPSKSFMDIKGRNLGDSDGNNDDMCVVTVEAGETLDIALDVKLPNSTLNWKYRTEDYDIGFAVYYNDQEKLLADDRVDSHVTIQEGSLNCTKTGRYTLKFDNTYSVLRSKSLHYMISIISPEDDEEIANY